MPGNGNYSLPHWKSFSNWREPHWAFFGPLAERPHCMTLCSWEKHRRVNTATWEQHVACPISAHLEQWRSLEIFFHWRIGASNRRPPQLPTLGRAWGFTKQIDVTFCFNFETRPCPLGLLAPADTLALWFLWKQLWVVSGTGGIPHLSAGLLNSLLPLHRFLSRGSCDLFVM